MTDDSQELGDIKKMFGDREDEYQIYVSCAKSLGWQIKSYSEWLDS